MFNRVIIIGLGLIGGSIAKAVKKHNLAQVILAHDTSDENLSFALDNNIINQIYNFKESLTKGDLVIISSPLSSYHEVIKSLVSDINADVIITDVGSVKSFIKGEVLNILGSFAKNFIPCHPIAGSEKSGVMNSFDDLFSEKKAIITKNDLCNPDSIKKVELFWRSMGSQVEFMDSEIHDKIFAVTSHFPQLISRKIKEGDVELSSTDELLERHLRLEKSNILIWKDIFNLNSVHLNCYLNKYNQNIDKIRFNIHNSNYEELVLLLRKSTQGLNLNEATNFNFNDSDSKKILARILAISAYTSMDDVSKYKEYFGTGFNDFTIILNYLLFLASKDDILIKLFDKHQEFLVSFLDKLEEIKS